MKSKDTNWLVTSITERSRWLKSV